MNNNQRIGSISNAHVGKEFEIKAVKYFETKNLYLNHNFSLPIGLGKKKKNHNFDLGNKEKNIIVECKSHTWTKSENVPSAKITVWNEAMYYFHLAPIKYKKIFFVKKSFSKKKQQTLLQYYLERFFHLIPNDIEFIEYDEKRNQVKIISFNEEEKNYEYK